MENYFDVYSLLNSKDMEEYLRKIEYKFNTAEIAVLIYRNRKIDINQKIEMYKEIVRSMPDMRIINSCEEKSIKDLIILEIKRIEELKKKFFSSKDKANYIIDDVLDSSYNPNCLPVEMKFGSWGEDAQLEIFRTIESSGWYNLKKVFSNEIEDEIIGKYYVENNENILVDLCTYSEPSSLSDFYLNLPHPFKKGDVLVCEADFLNCNGEIYTAKQIIVLDSLNVNTENNKYDENIYASAYFVSDTEAKLEHSTFGNYIDFKYYRGVYLGKNRLLKALSSYLKDKISLQLFLDANNHYIFEENIIDTFKYDRDDLKLAGFTEDDIDRYNDINGEYVKFKM
ncbi:MAG: hypothetical protein IJ809_02575 [Clostridia bacterium]|nr:hypothetical protein [Clostridia bacterium]